MLLADPSPIAVHCEIDGDIGSVAAGDVASALAASRTSRERHIGAP